MEIAIFDIECNGLNPDKIYVLSYAIVQNQQIMKQGSIFSYEDMRAFFLYHKVLCGHNIVRFDIPIVERILEIKVTAKKIDTLALSWYLFPKEFKKGKIQKRLKYGLENWGEELRVPKPEIKDWNNLTIEEYAHRCETDVEINSLLWFKCLNYLGALYGENNYEKVVNYLTFKLECMREQEENPCYIDTQSCIKHLNKINELLEEKISELSLHMPKIQKYKKRNKPKVFYNKEGEITARGLSYLQDCGKYAFPPDSDFITVPDKLIEPNPGSTQQLKSWLFSLGWEPTIYTETVSKVTGEIKEIPQIAKDGEICENIRDMYSKYPYLELLEGYSILKHRKGVFEGFLEVVGSGNTVQALMGGFTNTLRIQHRKPISNLPKVTKPWGKEIRGLIVAPDDDHLICGSDMEALEDTTKQHYMYFYDPDYVMEMRVPGFDPHLSIALFAGIMSEEDVTLLKTLKKKDDKTPEEKEKEIALGALRTQAKTVNFAGVYGAGAAKIAKTLKVPLAFAKKLHTAYWERNKAVKQASADFVIKDVGNDIWVQNPISKFWHYLRSQKDAFSTVNQSSGVYCFDNFIAEIRKRGIKTSMQYHDEVMFYLTVKDKETIKQQLLEAIASVNEKIKLNIPLAISMEFGKKYAETH